MMSISTRLATVADADVEFAPLGWTAPDIAADEERVAERLGNRGTWALLALAGADPVGHIAFTPARLRADGQARATGPPIPGLAHLWQLFVLPEWWGRGVAPLLHDAAVAEAGTREYEAMRLYTPALHARARRFYERRGWSVVGEFWSEDLALMLTEYRRPLT